MLGRARKFIFGLIIFFLSFQVGLHFWPQFSYVNGIRIDYLAPTLYLLDILIIAWIIVCAKSIDWKIKLSKTAQILILLLVLDLVWNLFFSKSPLVHLWGLVKLIELVLFGFLVAKTFKKDWVSVFVRALSLSAIISSVLAIWQFLIQSSVGGFWYFLGERTFTISTIGISTVNIGQQILRPYAAFPHPNLLAFFLFANIVFSTLRIPYEKKWWKYLLIAGILFSTFAITITFSRTLILLLIIFLFYEIYKKVSIKVRFFMLGFLQVVVPFAIVTAYFKFSDFLLRGVDFRQELLVQSLAIFQKSPYYGIGLNNFFVWQLPLIKTISPTNFQPPHNIFVVALLSLGLFGFFILPYLFYESIRSLGQKIKASNIELRSFYMSVLLVLISIIIVGFFDHFFVTLEQGEIMFALILGLSFINLNRAS